MSDLQPKEIIIYHKRSTLVLNDLNRLYDCGLEFDIKLTGEQVKEILEANIDIAFDLAKFGDDTEVGDRFFEAFVEHVTGTSWSAIQETFKEGTFKKHADYAYVTAKALEKGYTKTS